MSKSVVVHLGAFSWCRTTDKPLFQRVARIIPMACSSADRRIPLPVCST